MSTPLSDLPHAPADWHCDLYSDTLGVSIKVSDILFHKKTAFQDIKICQTVDFGKALLLNNFIYRTEKLNFMIPEMIAHVPMRTGFEKKKVLLIGGGDGYTANELTKYPSLTNIDVVDIDEQVVAACRRHFPVAAAAFQDPRVQIHISDGYEFLKQTPAAHYDVIFVTGTEGENLDGLPGLSHNLFQEQFFQECHRCLQDHGLLFVDGSTVYFDLSRFNYVYITKLLKKQFKTVKTNFLVSGTLLSGLFAMVHASKKHDPEQDILTTHDNISTQYYNRQIHVGSFALPELMKKKLATA